MPTKIASLYAEISGDTTKLQQSLKNSGDDVKSFGSSMKSTFTSAVSSFAKITGAAAIMGTTFKQAFNLGKAGAELLYTSNKFDKLTTSIGTTSDALLTDLKAATKGLVSDAELTASAVDLMALGLTKTHDEALRLTTVAAGLGMDMNQLVLTLTNMTTMRFDALGVSVDGFDQKVKALEKSGLSAADAFKEAFLQQAEGQLQLVGERAGEGVAAFDRLEASSENLANSIKKDLAPGLTTAVEALDLLLNWNQRVSDAYDDHADSVLKTAKNYQEYYDEMIRVAVLQGKLTQTEVDLAREEADFAAKLKITASQLGILSKAGYEHELMLMAVDRATGEAIPTTDKLSDSADGLAGALYGVSHAASDAYKGITKIGDINPNLFGNIGGALGQIDYAQAGGAEYDAAAAMIEAGVDEMGGANASAETLAVAEQALIDLSIAYGQAQIDAGAKTSEVADTISEELNMSLKEAKELLSGTKMEIDSITGNFNTYMHVWIITHRVEATDFDPSQIGGSGLWDPYGLYQGRNGNGKKFATGASFTVPAGYNDNFPIMAKTGERVDIQPAGQPQAGVDELISAIKALPSQISRSVRDAMLTA